VAERLSGTCSCAWRAAALSKWWQKLAGFGLVAVAACNAAAPPRDVSRSGSSPDAAVAKPTGLVVSVDSGADASETAAAWRALVEKNPGIDERAYRKGVLVPATEVRIPKNPECYPYEAFCTSETATPPAGSGALKFSDCYPFAKVIGQVQGAGPVWLVAFDVDSAPPPLTYLASLEQELTREKRRKDPTTCCYLLRACK
jgi:hypothetical protein